MLTILKRCQKKFNKRDLEVNLPVQNVDVCSELTEVKEHDREVTIQANQALDDVCNIDPMHET